MAFGFLSLKQPLDCLGVPTARLRDITKHCSRGLEADKCCLPSQGGNLSTDLYSRTLDDVEEQTKAGEDGAEVSAQPKEQLSEPCGRVLDSTEQSCWGQG